MPETSEINPSEAFLGSPPAGRERLTRRLLRHVAVRLGRVPAVQEHATERVEQRLREAEAKYRTLVEQLPLVTYIDELTPTATSIYASPQVESLLGYSVQEWLDDPEFFAKLLHPDDRDRVLTQVDHCNRTAEPFHAEYRLIARDGRTVWVQDESLVVCDENGRALFTQGYLLDITDRKEAEAGRERAEAKLRHQALHDGLTGLPNRTLFHDRVGHALELSRRTGASLAVLLMDLDCFKEINDTLGHLSGDALLRELGDRLQSCVRASDTVARLGGDEFGFLLVDVTRSEVTLFVERIQQAFAEPLTFQNLPLRIEASIGIALSPEHGGTGDVLLQRADVAMYVAKRSGLGFAFYDAESDEHTLSRLKMVVAKRSGAAAGQLDAQNRVA